MCWAFDSREGAVGAQWNWSNSAHDHLLFQFHRPNPQPLRTAWFHLTKRRLLCLHSCGQLLRPDNAADLDHQAVLTIEYSFFFKFRVTCLCAEPLTQGRVQWERSEIDPTAPTHDHLLFQFHRPNPQPLRTAWFHLTKRRLLCLHSCGQLLRPDDCIRLKMVAVFWKVNFKDMGSVRNVGLSKNLSY